MSGYAAVLAVFLTILLPNVAQAQYETDTGSLEVTDSTLAPGGSVVISGSGFDPGSTVRITIESVPMSLGAVDADAQGRISTTVRIPQSMSPGSHTLKATGVTPDGATLVLSSQITILGASGDLAGTGSNLGWMTALGVALLASAVAAMWAVRRKARV